MHASIDVFKHVLFRISAESISIFDGFKETNETCSSNLTRLALLENRKNELRLDICDVLFVLINVIDDTNSKKLLINFKRDVFNGRLTSGVKQEALQGLFTYELAAKYQLYKDTIAAIDSLSSAIDLAYAGLYNSDLDVIEKVCANDVFQCGLLLSSEILLKYAKIFVTDRQNVDESTIIGLWKYVSRAITKTTPFSTFTQLNTGILTNDISELLDIREISPRTISHIRYNNYALEVILLLIKNHPLFFRLYNLKVNSTLKVIDSGFVFFTNNNNKESFQTVNRNDIIDFIIDKIKQNKEITASQLFDDIMTASDGEYSRSEVEKYVFELVRTGLLEINVALSGLDSEWDRSLKTFVQTYISGEDVGKEMIDILEKLESSRHIFGTQVCDERKKTLQAINQLFADLVEALRKTNTVGEADEKSVVPDNYVIPGAEQQGMFLHRLPSGKETIDFKNIIYEDTAKDIGIKVNAVKMNDFMAKLGDLMSAYSCIPFNPSDKSINFHFYNSVYPEHKEVNLLAFYEAFYKAKANEPEAFAALNQYDTGDQARINDIWNRINNFVGKQRNSDTIRFANNECEITSSFLDKFKHEFKDVMPEPKRDTISYGSFIHFFSDEQQQKFKGVCIGILPGSGRMMSRFLHLFGEEITEDIRSWNISKIIGKEYHAENSDASFFNANLHPSIMPYEVEMPGGNTRSPDNLINVSELKVRPNTQTKQLELFNKDGERVFVYDLGFQNQMHRSNLYRMLCSFGYNSGYPIFNVAIPFSSLFSANLPVEGSDQKITISPRVVYDDTIVLQRKKWQIPVQILIALLKSHSSAESKAIYMVVQKWRISLSIPDLVFIRAFHVVNPNEKNQNAQLNKDDYKPQYINFLSPISVKLFIKTVNKLKNGNLFIEEMLPLPENLFGYGDKKYVIETLVQWQ